MYAVGDVRGAVRQEPDGARLKVESQQGAIAAEWPIVSSVGGAIDLITGLCEAPMSFASGEGESAWMEGIRSGSPPERMRLKGGDCLFLLSRRPTGSYALSLRTPSSRWETLAEPLIKATASQTSRRELFDMYEEVTGG
jgi:hypothetical protein